MIELVVSRVWPKESYTIGKFFVNDKRLCESLEDTDRGLLDSMPATEILYKKVYGKTAIPKGRYEVKLTQSPKFASRSWAKKYGGLVPEICNVKCYSGVRIHPANRAEEILGCIAIGENTKKGMVLNSVKWYDILMREYLFPAHMRGEKIYITIR